MPTAQEIRDADLSSWANGARLFTASDGRSFVVEADLADYPDAGNVKVVRRPTVLLFTNGQGHPSDLTPDFTFPPGTTHENAVTGAGYEITETN